MNILFICTHNRCRSILSEAIANDLGHGQLRAWSAGSQPAGVIHPATLAALARHGIATDGLYSKSWDVFESMRPDIVITVCDSAAQEACPVWFGDCVKVHWGLPDPSKLSGDEAAVSAAFDQVITTIKQRMGALLALELSALSRAQQHAALAALSASY